MSDQKKCHHCGGSEKVLAGGVGCEQRLCATCRKVGEKYTDKYDTPMEVKSVTVVNARVRGRRASTIIRW